MNTTNNEINATKNTTNEGMQIESEVRQQVEEMQRDTENISKGNANEVKSALRYVFSSIYLFAGCCFPGWRHDDQQIRPNLKSISIADVAFN